MLDTCRKLDPLHKILKARLGMKSIEARLDLEHYHPSSSLVIRLFERLKSFYFSAQSSKDLGNGS
jgi:hypothetical protein